MSNFAMQWLGGLWAQTLCLSVVLAAIVVLRPWLLRGLGATAAYALWIGVPLALVALALPVAPATTDMQPTTIVRLKAAAFAQLQNPLDSMAAMTRLDDGRGLAPVLATVLFLLWAAGLALCLTRMVVVHRHIQRQLRLQAGMWRSPAGSGPALVGFFQTRLCLPEDFEQRFSAEEQGLILAHEAVHQRRHDNLLNLLGSLLCCVHWFNPLCWLALRRWRADQELSCDAQVLHRQSPEGVRAYARALVKAQDLSPLSTRTPTLVCTWQAQHPLLERVTMLKQHRALPLWRRRTALLLSLGLGLLGAAAVHAVSADAVQPKTEPPVVQGRHFVEVDVDLQINGEVKRQVRVTMMRGNPQWIFSDKGSDTVASKTTGQPWAVQVQATPVGDESFRLEIVVLRLDPKLPPMQALQAFANVHVIAKPVIVTKAGIKARVEIADEASKETFSLDLTPRWILKDPYFLDGVEDRS